MNQFAKQSIKCFARTNKTNMQMQIVTLKLKFTSTWTFENDKAICFASLLCLDRHLMNYLLLNRQNKDWISFFLMLPGFVG